MPSGAWLLFVALLLVGCSVPAGEEFGRGSVGVVPDAPLVDLDVHGELHGNTDELQPKTYRSRSGSWALTVDPGARSGAGQATYSMSRDGKPAWSRTHQFTLWNAAVADDGTVGGYGYSDGYNGSEEFLVALLSADGAVRLLERTPRDGLLRLHDAPSPKGLGLFLNDDRLVVRVDDASHEESWWSYDLQSARAADKRELPLPELDADQGQGVIDARSIPGTPLVLVHWWLRTHQSNGARFTLVDASGRTVWLLDAPDDYYEGDEDAGWALMQHIRRHGAILGTARAAFAVRRAKEGERVSYRIDGGDGDWRIVEVAREPYEPAPVTAPFDVARVEVEPAGTIKLARGESSAPPSPINHIGGFAIDGRGRFGVLVGCGCEGSPALVLVDADGTVLRSVALPGGAGATRHVVWLEGDRWLVTTNFSGTIAMAHRIDMANGGIGSLAEFAAPRVDGLARTSDGGFVALTDGMSTWAHALVAFDRDGKPRWNRGGPDSAEPEQLFSPEGVTVTASGNVVVLENISDELKVFATDGRFVRQIDLKKAWKREPNYPTGIRQEGDGVIVYDFRGHPPIVRMALDGAVLGTLSPKRADGRGFDIHGDVQVAPDGRRWTSDGQALLRLDAQGVVDRTIGGTFDPGTLGEIAGLAIGTDGRIHAVDERTGALHVFDEQGRHIHVGEPAPDDYDGSLSLPSVTVSDSGDAYVARRDAGDDGTPDFLHYSVRGERVGIEALPLDDIRQEWLAQPGKDGRWILGFESIFLVDDESAVLRRIERGADGRWLQYPGPAAVAPDGSLAVATGTHSSSTGSTEGARVALFNADGTPRAAWSPPAGFRGLAGQLAWDGNRVAFLVPPEAKAPLAQQVMVTDAKGAPIYQFTAPGTSDDARLFFVHREDGTELWVFDGRDALIRYRLP